MIFLDLTREVFEGQSNANNKENKQKNNHHSNTHTVEYDQDHTHAGEYHSRQIRYTSDQLYKIGKSSYITKFSYTTANTIKSLDIRQTFRTKRTDRRRKERRHKICQTMGYKSGNAQKLTYTT